MVAYVIITGLVGIAAIAAFDQFDRTTDTAVEQRSALVARLGGELTPTDSLGGEIARAAGKSAINALTNGGAILAVLSFQNFGSGFGKLRKHEDGAASHGPAEGERSVHEEPSTGTCSGGACRGGGKGCFAAGTEVATPDGPTPIERLQPGDPVLSRDPSTGAFEVRRVVRTYVRLEAPVVRVRALDAQGAPFEVRSTRGHLYWTARGWTRADHLADGDGLLDDRDGPAQVSVVEPAPETATVYNLEVEGTHSYFVGPGAVWVDDMSPDSRSELADASSREEVFP